MLLGSLYINMGKKLISFYSITNIQTLILGLIVGDNGPKRINGGKEIM